MIDKIYLIIVIFLNKMSTDFDEITMSMYIYNHLECNSKKEFNKINNNVIKNSMSALIHSLRIL